jgi:ACS family pantothenate transporter-like MFS transporter
MVQKDTHSLKLSRESTDWPVEQEEHHSIELDPLSTNDGYEHMNRMDEIELVHRLDKRLLLFAMFGNLVKALDNTNLGTFLIIWY